jgi:hypothetical protein
VRSFLRNDGYEKPVLCRKYLFCSLILLIALSAGHLLFMVHIFTDSTYTSSEALRVSMQIMFIFVSCFFTRNLVSAITRLIGVRKFFKISQKLLSVGSFVNYHEGTTFSNAVIALHVVLFVRYLFRYSGHYVTIE